LKFEPNAGIGQKGAFFKGLLLQLLALTIALALLMLGIFWKNLFG